jgi:hypothetical protein
MLLPFFGTFESSIALARWGFLFMSVIRGGYLSDSAAVPGSFTCNSLLQVSAVQFV